MEIKASDLLLQMNERLTNIENIVKNIDFTYKLTLQKVNEFNIDKSKIIVPNIPKEKEEILKTSTVRKVTVHQKVSYSNDKPVVLAKVKIFDSNKNEIKELLTNHTGKWNMVLEPGNYYIHIIKAEISGKPKVDKYFPIEVINTQTSLELETVKI